LKALYHTVFSLSIGKNIFLLHMDGKVKKLFTRTGAVAPKGFPLGEAVKNL